MTEIQKKIFSLRDEKYQAFQSSLVPGVEPESIIGVRVPKLRSYAKELWKEHLANREDTTVCDFISNLPHEYYEENLLHGFLLEFIKDFDEAVQQEDRFVPYINNWAVCDTTHPKVFKKHTDELFQWIIKWIDSGKTYSIRYGVNMLMSFYLDEHFDEKYLELVSGIKSEEYYVNMMRAWFFATALAKQYDSAVKYIEQNRMDSWTHNKTIQKAVESFRVSEEHKTYLRTLKVK